MNQVEANSRIVPAIASIALLAMLLLIVLGGQASAARVDPEVVRGSPVCSDYSASGIEFTISASERFQESDSGQFTDGTLVVDVTFYQTSSGQEFDWSANLEVDVIVAKGGSLASIYRYAPPVTSDSGLHSPFNDTRSLWYPSTYISFCYLKPQAKPTVETTTTEATTTTIGLKATTTTIAQRATTTIPAEVLPSVVTTSSSTTSTTKPAGAVATTIPAEVKGTEVLPFTGMSDDMLWLLGLSLIAAGGLAVFSTYRSRRDEE